MFYSIQGEGESIGKPAIFIRLQGCNLRCNFCDTKYTWEDGGVETTNKEIIDFINKYPTCRRIIFTGGEPYLQIIEIQKLINEIDREVGMPLLDEVKFEIETNGTNYFEQHDFDIISVSPKRDNVNPVALRFFNDNRYGSTFFKFVISNKDDFSYWLNIINSCELDMDKIIMMPEGVDDNKIKETAKWLVEECKNYNFRFSNRLHVWLWGNIKGV
jgi:7-carboxy-7-deazaguanine synthase